MFRYTRLEFPILVKNESSSIFFYILRGPLNSWDYIKIHNFFTAFIQIIPTKIINYTKKLVF